MVKNPFMPKTAIFTHWTACLFPFFPIFAVLAGYLALFVYAISYLPMRMNETHESLGKFDINILTCFRTQRKCF